MADASPAVCVVMVAEQRQRHGESTSDPATGPTERADVIAAFAMHNAKASVPAIKVPCRHCHKKRGSRPRCLCWHCYDDRSIRCQYPSLSKWGQWADRPSQETTPLPVESYQVERSAGRIADMAERAARGLPLFD